MAAKEKKKRILFQKFIYTVGIVLVYILGRDLPVYGIDTSAYRNRTWDAQALLLQTVTGDRNQSSVFALGISPYMIASMIVMVIVACRSTVAKSKISPKKINRVTIEITLALAVIQAILRVRDLTFVKSSQPLVYFKCMAIIELIAGAMIILWLSGRNKKYGIGGQTTLIYINILDGILSTILQADQKDLRIPLVISFFVIVVVIIMENAEKRIPMQRISIHNIYADKNYLAIKLNPIGVMPVMLSTAFFMLPQMVIKVLNSVWPDNTNLLWLDENMVLTRPLGVGVYIAIIYLLTIVFSIVFISPADLTEQFLKSGDSIVNLQAGKETKWYLIRQIFLISLFSATAMSICMGIPMVLLLEGELKASLVMFPSSMMMLTGIWCSLDREVLAIKSYESYKPFIS